MNYATAFIDDFTNVVQSQQTETWIVMKEHSWSHDEGTPTLAYLLPSEFGYTTYTSLDEAAKFIKNGNWPSDFVAIKLDTPTSPVLLPHTNIEDVETAAGICDAQGAWWRKQAQKHLPHYNSDHARRDLMRAEICENLGTKIRSKLANTESALVGWHPLATAPTDNKRMLYLAKLNADGSLNAIDFDGIWEHECGSWETPENYWYWASALGIEEPTHWAFQDEPIPVMITKRTTCV